MNLNNLFQNLKGDKAIWAAVTLLAIFSFMPVYSASSNIAYRGGNSDTFSFFIKHFFHLSIGFAIMYGVHKIPYHYFKGLSLVFMPVAFVLLLLTILQGTTIEGSNASRWITIPIVGMSFQTSTLAGLTLMVYIARYMAKMKDEKISLKGSLLPLWVPVFFMLICILPANFSTTAILFVMVLTLVYLGGFPIKYLMLFVGIGVLSLTLFVLTVKAFPGVMPNRVDTWISRVQNFSNNEVTEADYQIEKAKIAIATGGIKGLGPGKSIQKNFLPQSSSDFIYAIIVEEYGIIGGVVVMLLYMFLLFRIVIVSHKADTVFGKLVVLGAGLPIVFQALINMAVAVELFPVTGQTLPLLSSGGSSIWMTCLAFGIILSVSAKREEIRQKQVFSESENPLEILSETL